MQMKDSETQIFHHILTLEKIHFLILITILQASILIPAQVMALGKLLDRHAFDPILWRVRLRLWPIGVLRLYQAVDEERDECTICLANFVPGKEVGHSPSF